MTDSTDGSDQGTSSEDLIRQARESYIPTDYSGRTPAAPPDGTSPPVDRTSKYDTPATATISRPSDYVRSEYRDQPAEPGTATMPTYQPETPSFFSRYGRLLIFGVVIAGFIIFNMLDKTKSVEALAVGDCLLMPEEEEIIDVETADCQGEHQLEVFAIITLLDGPTVAYPGDEKVSNDILDQCLPRFEPYVGTSYNDSDWYINTIYPSPESWAEDNDRVGKCVLFQPDGIEDVMMLSGSARNSNK